MPLKPGTILHNSYRIVRFINSGGFGCTYEAEHIEFEKRVAIKEFFVKDLCNRNETTGEVTVGITERTEFVEKLKFKFKQEAKVINNLSHPNIVRVTDVFEENGTAYYVMDYIDGQSLSQLVKQHGPLSESVALNYIRQVASALGYLHSQNRLHLDVKPGNIMLANDGHVVLIDFGASKQYDYTTGENTSTLLGYTPGYAAPEQISHNVKFMSAATDIYSLGATLYNLLSGNVPNDPNDRWNNSLLPLPASVSPTTSAAVFAALNPSLKGRPQTISAFLANFDETSEEETTEGIDETTIIGVQPIDEPQVQQTSTSNGKEYIVNGVKFNMIRVDGGTFQRKKEKLFSSKNYDITLDGFYIAETQVTQELWEAVMGSNPSRFIGNQRPVEQVSHEDCITFINKLNEITGEQFRLPTEAEWEFAARSGNKSHGYKFSGSDDIKEVAWYYDNSGGETHNVKAKKPNELGLYDMSGNVWEWCSDRYRDYPSESLTNPKGPNKGSFRVLRGGGWLFVSDHCRIAYRNCDFFSSSSSGIGLRLAQ